MNGDLIDHGLDRTTFSSRLDERPTRAPDHEAENTTLAALAELMASEPAALLDRVVQSVLALTRADSAGLGLLPTAGAAGAVRWVSATGPFAPALRGTATLVPDAVARALARGEAVLFARAGDVVASLAQSQPPVSESLLVAFQVGGHPAGVLWALRHAPGHRFEREDGRLLLGLARFASAACRISGATEAARVARRESDERLLGAELLHRMGSQLIPRHQTEQLYEQALSAAMALTKADAASLQELTADNTHLSLTAWRNLHPDSAAHWRLLDATGLTCCAKAARSFSRARFEDVEAEPELAGTADLAEYRRSAIRACQSTPLVTRSGRVIGLISTHWKEPRQLADGQFRLFDVLVRQIADLIDRARAEEALRDSEQRFRGLVEGFAQAIWETDPVGRVIADSPTWRSYTGQTLEEWRGFGWVNAIHPDDRANAERQWQQAVVGRHDFDAEYRLRHAASGGHRWTNVRAVMIRDADGTILKWSGMNIDIDQRKRAQEALRESEARLAADLEAMRELQRISGELVSDRAPAALYERIVEVAAVLMHADAASLWEASLHAARLHDAGAEAERLDLLAWRGLHPGPVASLASSLASLRPETAGACGRAFATGERVLVDDLDRSGRSPADAALGQSGIRSVQFLPLRGRSGRIVGMLSTHWRERRHPAERDFRHFDVLARLAADLIERVQVSAQLRASEERLSALVATLDLGAFLTRTFDGTIRHWSEGCARLYGWTADEAVGRNAHDLLKTDYPVSLSEIETSLKCRGEWTGELHQRARDGRELAVAARKVVTRDAGGSDVAIMEALVDVTAQRRAEAALRTSEARLRELQAELLHVSRLSAAGEMAAALAHELNQPLTAVSNALRAALRILRADGARTELPAVLFQSLDLAAGQALRAGQIVHRLREFVTGNGDADLRLEPLQQLVEAAALLARAGAKGSGIAIGIRLAPDLPPVLANRVQIQQVLVNLLRNALEAMAEPAAAAPGDQAREVTVSAAMTGGDTVEVAVADTGPGLAPEVAARLFEAFVSTKPAGMGIGLSICRSIIEAHGGRLWAEPNGDAGTVFRFTLTVPPADAAEWA